MMYVYFFTDARAKDPSQSRAMWIPLDFLLTIGITIYLAIYSRISLSMDTNIKFTETKFATDINGDEEAGPDH